jgi:hypothetical protein
VRAIAASVVLGIVAVCSVAIAGATLVSAGSAGEQPTVLDTGARGESEAAVSAALTTPAAALPTGMPTERPDKFGAPLDAASLEEFGYARALANAEEAASATRADGTAGYEFLTLDIPEGVSAGERILEIQSYDYSSSELVSQMVDLIAASVTETRASGARPAPSDREGLLAMSLLIDSDAAAVIREKFAELTGEALTSPAQLDYVPASNVPAIAMRSVPDCATDRCITFQGRSLDGVWLYLSQIVVNLTDKTVHTLT